MKPFFQHDGVRPLVEDATDKRILRVNITQNKSGFWHMTLLARNTDGLVTLASLESLSKGAWYVQDKFYTRIDEAVAMATLAFPNACLDYAQE